MKKDHLTNERVRTKFTNQFDLINYTIKLAEDLIVSGRSPRLPVTTDNPALQAIEELLINEDECKECKEISSIEEQGLTEKEEETLENFS